MKKASPDLEARQQEMRQRMELGPKYPGPNYAGMDIADILRAYRHENGISVVGLAAELGVGRQYIYALENGRNVPSAALTAKIMALVGLRVVLLPRAEKTVVSKQSGAKTQTRKKR
jgi:DNA-binding XRE family transcriptional regulator